MRVPPVAVWPVDASHACRHSPGPTRNFTNTHAASWLVTMVDPPSSAQVRFQPLDQLRSNSTSARPPPTLTSETLVTLIPLARTAGA
jgi:hypothetical protein